MKQPPLERAQMKNDDERNVHTIQVQETRTWYLDVEGGGWDDRDRVVDNMRDTWAPNEEPNDVKIVFTWLYMGPEEEE